MNFNFLLPISDGGCEHIYGHIDLAQVNTDILNAVNLF
jgi:predicted transcriptional regulator